MQTTQKTNNINKLNIAAMSVIVGVIIMGFVLDAPLSLIALIFNVALFVYLPTEYVLYDLLFLSPFASIYKLSPDSLSFFSIIETLVVIIVLIRAKHISLKALIGIFGFALYLAVGSLVWSDLTMIDWVNPLLVLFIIYLYTTEFQKIDVQKLMRYFIFATLGSSFLALFANLIPSFYIYVRKLVYSESVIRFSGLNGDSNYYSVNLIFALIFSFLLYKNKGGELLFWLECAMIAYFGILTYSKSFLLMFVIIMIVVFLDYLRCKKWGVVALFCIGALFLLLQLLQGKLEMVNGVIERLTRAEGSLDRLTTGRWEIWKDYVSVIFTNLQIFLFGAGINGPLINRYSPHNLYIDVLYHFGVIGTIVLIGTIVVCMRHKNKISLNKYKYLGAMVFFVMYFFLHGVQSYEICFHIFFVYLVYHFTVNDKSRKNDNRIRRII